MNPINFNLVDDSEELNLELVDDNEEITFSMTDYDDTEVKELIDNVDNKVDTLETNVNNQIDNINDDINLLERNVQTNTTNISNLQTNKADKTQVNTLANQVNTNTGQIAQNKADISTLDNTKQDKLISGQNIKTINNESVLGSGNINIEGVTNYEELNNLPSINNVQLKGNKTSNDLGLQPSGDYALRSEIPDVSDFITKDVNDLTYYTKTSDLASVATSGDYDDLTDKPVMTYIDTEINNRVVTQVTRTKTIESTHDNLYYGTYHFIPLNMSSYTSSTGSKALKPEDYLPAGRYVVTNSGYIRLGSTAYKLDPGTFIFWDGSELNLIGYNACEYWSYNEGEWEGGYFTTQVDVESMLEDAVISTVVHSGNFDVASKDNGYYLFNYSASSGTGKRLSINVEGTSSYYYPYNGTILIKNDRYVVMLGRENLIFEYDSENNYYKTPIELKNTPTTTQITAWDAKYDKPSTGIPKTDLASDVQTSLGKADSALQSITSSDVTTALGYTPYNSTNPDGYTSNTGTITSVKMNGTTVASSGEADLGTVITQHQSLDGCVKKDGGSTQQTISLTGGTGTTALGLKSMASSSYLSMTGTGGWLGSYGVSSDKKPVFYNGTGYTLAYTSDVPKVFYGTSSTGATTAAKVVTCEDFTASDLVAGTRITVLFTNANTYNGQATLNINGTGAKNIYYNGTTTNARYMWVAGETVDFIYNGTQWATINGGLATTSYYGVTKLATGANSDSQSYALTPRSLYYFANYSIAPYYSSSKTYAVGDKVRYTYYLYKCKTAIETAEAWNAEHWEQIDTIQEQIDNIYTYIDNLNGNGVSY